MSILEPAILTLEKSGSESPKLDAELLLGHVLNCSRIDLKTKSYSLTPAQEKQFHGLVERRLELEPMAYILGSKEFWSLNFKVSPAVLCPRPDTEILVETALKLVQRAKPLRVLDLGTGSGAILLSLLHELPQATGVGVDVSAEAIEIAKENAVHLGLASRAQFLLGSWCDGLSGEFDLIVSNPPYIESAVIPGLTPEVSVFEPKVALDGGKDGLDPYRILASQVPLFLKPGGWAVFEVGATQASAVQQLMSEQKLENFSIAKDYQGIDRCVIAQRA